MENWYESYTMAKIKQEEILKESVRMHIVSMARSNRKHSPSRKKHGVQWLGRKIASRFLSRSGKFFINLGSSLQKHSIRLCCSTCNRDKRLA